MTLKKLNALIDEALNDGVLKLALPKTNILNAEFALGKYFAYMDLIEELYGVNAMVETHDRTQAIVDDYSKRANRIYHL